MDDKLVINVDLGDEKDLISELKSLTSNHKKKSKNFEPEEDSEPILISSLAKKKKDGKEVTSWHKCVAFDKTAETIAKFVTKGQTILIEGELLYGQYEKDGITRYTTDIAVNSFTFAGKGFGSDNSASGNSSSNGSSSFVPMEDDIPF